METEYILKMSFFILLGLLGLFFIYKESMELEEEVANHEQQCNKEIQKWKGVN